MHPIVLRSAYTYSSSGFGACDDGFEVKVERDGDTALLFIKVETGPAELQLRRMRRARDNAAHPSGSHTHDRKGETDLPIT